MLGNRIRRHAMRRNKRVVLNGAIRKLLMHMWLESPGVYRMLGTKWEGYEDDSCAKVMITNALTK